MTTAHDFVAFLALTADLPSQQVLRLAHHPDFTLSRCASDVLGIIRSEEFAHEDIDLHYAPSECHGLVTRHADKAVRVALRKHGYTGKSFVRELVERTSEGWVYRSSIGHRVFEAVENAGNRSNRAHA